MNPLSTTHLLCAPLSEMLPFSGHCCCCWQPLDSIVQGKGSREKDRAWAVDRPSPLRVPSRARDRPRPTWHPPIPSKAELGFWSKNYIRPPPQPPSQLPHSCPSPLTPKRGHGLLRTCEFSFLEDSELGDGGWRRGRSRKGLQAAWSLRVEAASKKGEGS